MKLVCRWLIVLSMLGFALACAAAPTVLVFYASNWNPDPALVIATVLLGNLTGIAGICISSSFVDMALESFFE